jgi:low affinity Fe/Cu permease
MSFPYFVAALASVIASALLFNALTNSIVGEAMGLQRLKRFLQEKGWRLRIDIAVRIIIFVVVTFAVDTSTVMGEVL